MEVAFSPELALNTLQLLRSYTASHAVFNGLAAMQHALLKHEREQGLYLLNLFSGYLRRLSGICREPFAVWMDEQAALLHYMDLENIRYSPDCRMDAEATQASFIVPSLLCIPAMERQLFRALRVKVPLQLKVNLLAKKDHVQMQVLCSEALPAFNSLALNAEQIQRMQLFQKRMQLFGAEVQFSESKKGAILQLNKSQLYDKGSNH